ncbi:STRUBBELIG-receptor family 3 [Actinidia rufa]|uniref:STRUBBELIG-receptor family 3 n=1 Tax=Actinidia rufa TaxID=165716 RepID=A0A7J0DRW9_9ERIC|nr:STRUBBELIG-receptor family 3 [Actinidia rufa]
MGHKRSAENCLNWVQGFVWFVLIFTARISGGITNPSDVAAINNLYAALGYPTLPGWVPTGGDPCAKAWQGVACNSTNIISITLNAANLGGELGDDLGSFSSLNKMQDGLCTSYSPTSFDRDLSNNHIGGSIPSNFPMTMQNMNIENNLFNGPVPENLLTIPNFKKDGNPLNTTSSPLPSPTSSIPPTPTPPLAGAPYSGQSNPEETNSKRTKNNTERQYTNSFSRENLIGAGTLGTVYRAELPNGKLLAIKKLDKRAFSQQKNEEFLDLVNSIDQIRHVNVVELIGYCAEHGQRLLIYEYYRNGTLQDALHSDDEFKRQLTWNIRIRMALGAARALEYLHEVCEPPIIHLNFKSANILLENELAVYVSDCGLASLISSGSMSQVIFNQLSENLLTADGYRAPEFESGIYTLKSDVFSFGVVMLELLTGRKSHDRKRNRGEQFLVRWAIPQLHDIDTLSSMVDPSLNGKYPVKSLSQFAHIISRCVQRAFQSLQA